MSDYINDIQESLLAGDVTVISIIVAVVAVFITILILICRGSSNKRQGILLAGLCDSGKTLLYSRLVDNRYVDTHTSIKENRGIYRLPGSKSHNLRIIDLPGYERLRNTFLDQYKPLARGIIFVIDSSTVIKEIKEVGEYLYHLLMDSVISKNNPPILIVCNKQDQTLAKGAIVVKRLLEKELDTVRKTQAAALEETSTVHINNVFLGRRNKEFEFADLKPQKVEFVECSLCSGKDDVDKVDMEEIIIWLDKTA
ncbi:hypothetical protein LSH36_278g03031 [Paralvinella palmiformis]|uniref:Signal recognition particle receptor subunit beta n=1 Tax=Paralvinella palmiformis TaxID=53620 RepID=A0AAD9JJ67_9ANNE|nr:hypothetical protein LSH36_278g03031 [Paralvinella palmiformis]